MTVAKKKAAVKKDAATNGQEAPVEATEAETPEAEDTEAQEIRAAFDTAMDAGEADEDEIKLAMISAGATFKNVTRLYNQFMEDSGMALSKDAKTKIADVAIAENDVSTEEGFDAAVDHIIANGDGKVNERSASGLVRAAAKRKKIECFKKARPAGEPRVTFMSGFFEALLENPHMTEKECEDYVMASKAKSAIRYIANNQAIRKMANDIAAKYA